MLDGAGPGGKQLASLALSQAGARNDKVAFEPYYPRGGSTYFFNLGDMLGAKRENPCTLFESNSDYPMITPLRSVGADGVGNTVGRRIFGRETYTFWITFNTEQYILPQARSNDWEAQIVCGFKS